MSQPDVRDERERLKAIEALVKDVINMAAVIPIDDAEALSRAMDHAEAFMPFYDPTGWMQQNEGMRVARDIIAAFLVLRRAIEKAKHDERARRETQRLRQTGARP